MGNVIIFTFIPEIKELPAEKEFHFMFVFVNLSSLLRKEVLKEMFTNPVITLSHFCFPLMLMVK